MMRGSCGRGHPPRFRRFPQDRKREVPTRVCPTFRAGWTPARPVRMVWLKRIAGHAMRRPDLCRNTRPSASDPRPSAGRFFRLSGATYRCSRVNLASPCACGRCEIGATENRWNGIGKPVITRSTFPRFPWAGRSFSSFVTRATQSDRAAIAADPKPARAGSSLRRKCVRERDNVRQESQHVSWPRLGRSHSSRRGVSSRLLKNAA